MPKHYKGKQLLATAYLIQGDIRQAINAYEKVVESDAKSIDLSNLSIAYSLLGQRQKALSSAKLAVEKSPAHPTWILNLADALMLDGDVKPAQSRYQQVIALHQDKNDLKSWLERAQAYAHNDAGEAAVKALNKAKKLAPDSAEVAFIAALVYVTLDEQFSALTQVEEALNAGIGVVWFNLPWFDHLCHSAPFVQMMTDRDNSQRCAAK